MVCHGLSMTTNDAQIRIGGQGTLLVSPAKGVAILTPTIGDLEVMVRAVRADHELARALTEPSGAFMATGSHRLALLRVAEAIRAGVGHGIYAVPPGRERDKRD